jgi:hypothetical protein
MEMDVFRDIASFGFLVAWLFLLLFVVGSI